MRRARQSMSAFFLLLVFSMAPFAGGYLLGHADATGPVRTPLESLLIWGLAQFRVVPVIQADRAYAMTEVPYGKQPLELVAARPLNAVARLGRPLTEKVVAASSVALPVKEGAVLGRVEIWERGILRGSSDLVASRTINKPGLASRLGWYAGRTLHHLGGLF